MQDQNCISYWYPKLAEVQVKTPKTRIKTFENGQELISCLDGERPEVLDDVALFVMGAAEEIGYPAFLRTGHTSGKHSWDRCCFLKEEDEIESKIVNLTEFSAMAGMIGLPTNTWSVRQFLPLDVRMYCAAYGNMPVAKEFRVFINNGKIECVHPYWPMESLLQGKPVDEDGNKIDDNDIVKIFSDMSRTDKNDFSVIKSVCLKVASVFDGYWSVDLCKHKKGEWYVTDMASGAQSYHWESCDKK